MDTLRPEQIMKILELTDSFNVSREAVTIPLPFGEEGSVTFLADGRLRIVAPKNRPFEGWLIDLKTQLANMDLSSMHH